MGKCKVLISLPEDFLKILDKYAKEKYMGNRSMAIYVILKSFFEKEEKA